MTIALTLDLDWAPDFVINYVADRLILNKVRATWFITHSSHAVDRLREYPELFEIGIHPNFLPGSSHGEDMKAVIEHCMSLVPGARSFRSHSIFQCGNLFSSILLNTKIRVDANTFLPEWSNIKPIKQIMPQGTLTRVPFFWIDDYELCKEFPSWTYDRFKNQPGLQVFAFHPVHIYLNSNTLTQYELLKKSNMVNKFENNIFYVNQNCCGVRTMFEEVVKQSAMSGGGKLIREFE